MAGKVWRILAAVIAAGTFVWANPVLGGFVALGGFAALVFATAWTAEAELKRRDDQASMFVVSVTPYKDPAAHVGPTVWLAALIITNKGRRCTIRPQLVLESVKGLTQAYPADSVLLRFPLPNEGKDEVSIIRNGQQRLDIAYVDMSKGELRFLGPRHDYMGLTIAPEHHQVSGLIDLEEVELDRSQRVQFIIKADPAHPMQIEAALVDHD